MRKSHFPFLYPIEEKKKTIRRCNGKWEEYKNKLEQEIKGNNKDMKYNEMEDKIKKAGNKVMIRKTVKDEQKVLGYNKTIKTMIKERRVVCHKWKTEKDDRKKNEYEQEYKRKRLMVNEEIEKVEAESIKNMIDETQEKKRLISGNS